MEEKLTQRPCNILKVVFYGPESTGKTTLAQMLAEHYNTVWASEYMRDYLQEKWDETGEVCQPEDLIPIAEGQIKRENEQTEKADKILFCDTDLLELKVYSEAYYQGFCPPSLLKPALKNHYHLYFLMYIDVPWVSDDLRDKPDDREGMFQRFENEIIKTNKPFVILKGDLQERFERAVKEVDKLLKKSKSGI